MWEPLLSMSGSIFTFLNGDFIDFIEAISRESEDLFQRIGTINSEDVRDVKNEKSS